MASAPLSKQQLIEEFERDAVRYRERLAEWQKGDLRSSLNYEDTTEQTIENYRSIIADLEKAIGVLRRDGE